MRPILAVLLGVAIGNATLLAVGCIANSISPTPPELMDPATPEAVAERVAAATNFTWLSTIFGLGLGAFVGGLIGARVDIEKALGITSTIGVVLSLWAVYTFYIVFPAVMWVPFAMLIASLLFSYLGGLVAKRFSGVRRYHS